MKPLTRLGKDSFSSRRLLTRVTLSGLLLSSSLSGLPTFAATATKQETARAETGSTPSTRIVFLGDSLTEGYGVSKSAAFPALVAETLKQAGYRNIEVLNAGISGSTSASGLSRLRWLLKGKDKPDILVLELGANDGLRGLDVEAMKKNLLAVVELAKAEHSQVLLAGMQMPPNYGKDYTRRFARIFPEVAHAEHIALIPFLLEGVAADPKLNQTDGIHPNAAGHKLVAKTVVKYLQPLLAK